jgi:PKD repeat protein
VTNAAPIITAVTVPANPTALGMHASAMATFTDAGTADTHVATFDWGDGTRTVVDAGAASSARDAHVYAAPGSYTVTVTVTDDDGASSTSRSSELVVYDASTASIGASRGYTSMGTR